MRSLFVLGVLILSLGPLAFGEKADKPENGQHQCTAQTTAGRYAMSCSGSMATSPTGPTQPFTILGTVTGDQEAVFSGTVNKSVGGLMTSVNLEGPATMNADCTGSITFNQGKADAMKMVSVTLGKGSEIRTMVVDPGTNILCDLKRINAPSKGNGRPE